MGNFKELLAETEAHRRALENSIRAAFAQRVEEEDEDDGLDDEGELDEAEIRDVLEYVEEQLLGGRT